MAQTAFGFAGDAYLIVGGSRPPTSTEWNGYLADFARFSDQPIGMLILVDSGLVDRAHRAAVHQLVNDATVEHPTSVVSRDPSARETVEVFRWLGANASFFPPEGVMGAMDFIGVPRERVEAVWSRARELERQIEGGRVDAIARAEPYVIRATQARDSGNAVNRAC